MESAPSCASRVSVRQAASHRYWRSSRQHWSYPILTPETDQSREIFLCRKNIGPDNRECLLRPGGKPIHPDATPLLLRDKSAREIWINARVEMAGPVQRSPAKGALKMVATDTKQDTA